MPNGAAIFVKRKSRAGSNRVPFDRLKPVLVRLQVYRTSEVEVLVRMESHPVTDRNCVPATGGGEHQEVNDQSVG